MAEVKLPDYNAMPHLPPTELIAKETEQRFSGWTGVGAALAPPDYTALERKCQELGREVERLRKIEAAALKLVNGKGRFHTEQNYAALAEACGRKG